MMMYVLFLSLLLAHVTHNKQFFLRLSELFDERRQKDHGSIYLTQKSRFSLYIRPAHSYKV